MTIRGFPGGCAAVFLTPVYCERVDVTARVSTGLNLC